MRGRDYPLSRRYRHYTAVPDPVPAACASAAAFARHGAPQVLHADNGAIMRSRNLLDALHAADTEASFLPAPGVSRPSSTTCPDRFDHARAWTAAFLADYADEHRHSGLAWHTPATVFHGRAAHQRQHRQTLLDRPIPSPP